MRRPSPYSTKPASRFRSLLAILAGKDSPGPPETGAVLLLKSGDATARWTVASLFHGTISGDRHFRPPSCCLGEKGDMLLFPRPLGAPRFGTLFAVPPNARPSSASSATSALKPPGNSGDRHFRPPQSCFSPAASLPFAACHGEVRASERRRVHSALGTLHFALSSPPSPSALSASSALKPHSPAQTACQRHGKKVINIKACTWHGWKKCEIGPKNR